MGFRQRRREVVQQEIREPEKAEVDSLFATGKPLLQRPRLVTSVEIQFLHNCDIHSALQNQNSEKAFRGPTPQSGGSDRIFFEV